VQEALSITSETARGLEKDAVELIQRLSAIGVALSAEQDQGALLETILVEAKAIAHADGGTLYFLVNGRELEFAILHNDTLGIRWGGTSPIRAPLPPLALYDPQSGNPNYHTQAVYCVLKNKPINIEDAYLADGFDFRGTREFDARHHFRTQSVLTIPLVSHKNEALGCLQLVNAKDPATGKVIPFSKPVQQVIHSLASQAAIILDNKILIESQEKLLEAFIELISKAIDRKSPYTGEHCQRVPALMAMFIEAACNDTQGHLKDFNLTEEEKYEVHIASWLHDCGKITTPVHVMDKATKLETIYDRIETLRTRWEVLKRDAHIALLTALAEKPAEHAALKERYEEQIAALDDELAFLEQCNRGGEFMSDSLIERLKKIAGRTWRYRDKELPLLSDNEVYNLSIRRGTITTEERDIMNDHMVVTAEMLETLPFPKHLRRVPEYAVGHHERMDGKGYPRGIKAGTMSVPARMMAVVDVFEALTASDRPYKAAKKLSETMQIIGEMKKTNHLDPGLVDFFITSKIYLRYARAHLREELIDAVDEEKLLAITPLPMND
jgi:HD-GYP domain-containing protein (c-di-GMP phosphodiesterase class II)